MFNQLDHLAIVVPDTDAALLVWRDKLGLPVRYSEVVNNGALRLTHLSLGGTQLQLVQPLVADHPLQAWLKEHGAGLHHFCFAVDDITAAAAELPAYGLTPARPEPHQGTLGRRALFINPAGTDGVQLELTGK